MRRLFGCTDIVSLAEKIFLNSENNPAHIDHRGKINDRNIGVVNSHVLDSLYNT